VVAAPENWWGHPSGPGGAGPGTGDAVSDGVDFSDWLTVSPGILVVPEAFVLTPPTGPLSFSVRFANLLLERDVLQVTVTDEHGWVTSPTSFTVDVDEGRFSTETVDLNVAWAETNAVTIRAVSQSDAEVVEEATVVVTPAERTRTLGSSAVAGSTVLDADGEGAFTVGGTIIINPGGATEERRTIAGFGSILLTEPLRFDHEAGELVVGANSAALPVELSAFAATLDAEAVALSWQTATETNNAGFEVERRVDNREWQTIHFVTGHGTTAEARTYRFTDRHLPFAAKTLTYRLRQVDLDGTSAYGPDVTVGLGAPDRFALLPNFPNPVVGHTTLRYTLPDDEHVRLTVYDLLGRQIATLVEERQRAGRYEIAFDAGRLPSGMYFARLMGEGRVQTQRIVVVR
jgi:hypothetical protein